MSIQAVTVQKQQAGTCPHGAPMGACPLCRGMGGGGGNVDRHDTRRRAGEMTWNECFAQSLILNQMKQRQLQEAQQNQAQLAFQNNAVAQMAGRFAAFVGNVVSNIASKALEAMNKTLIQPALNSIRNLVNVIRENLQNLTQQVKQVLNDIKQKIIDISDKLAAIFGEMKNALEKSVADRFKQLTKKVLSLFAFIDTEFATDDEDERVEDDKRAFELTQIKEKRLLNNDVGVETPTYNI